MKFYSLRLRQQGPQLVASDLRAASPPIQRFCPRCRLLQLHGGPCCTRCAAQINSESFANSVRRIDLLSTATNSFSTFRKHAVAYDLHADPSSPSRVSISVALALTATLILLFGAATLALRLAYLQQVAHGATPARALMPTVSVPARGAAKTSSAGIVSVSSTSGRNSVNQPLDRAVKPLAISGIHDEVPEIQAEPEPIPFTLEDDRASNAGKKDLRAVRAFQTTKCSDVAQSLNLCTANDPRLK